MRRRPEGEERAPGAPRGGSRSQGRAPRGRGAGLTLLEVVITIALLTAMTLGATMVLVPLARQSRIHREITIANAGARRVIESFLAMPFRDITRTYPGGTALEFEDLPGGTLSVSYADPSANPLEIHLDLAWTSPDLGSMAVSFVTLRTD